ncbi:MAG: helix-turn-helix transcriptional regulator [Clostridia bacterium]|nr:helix-turn-helix transcriptional regulator [Clostridia bacterium]
MTQEQKIEMGKRLRKLRKLTGNLSQQAVADILGMDRSSFSKYETGAANPSMSVLLKLCAIYDVGIEELLGGKENELTFCEREDENSEDIPDMRFGNLTENEVILILKMRLMDSEKRKKYEKMIIQDDDTE